MTYYATLDEFHLSFGLKIEEFRNLIVDNTILKVAMGKTDGMEKQFYSKSIENNQKEIDQKRDEINIMISDLWKSK